MLEHLPGHNKTSSGLSVFVRLAPAALFLIGALSGCARGPLRRTAPPPPLAARLLPTEEIPAFTDQLPRETLVSATERTLKYLEANPPSGTIRLGDKEYTAAFLAQSLRYFLQVLSEAPSPGALGTRLKNEFDIFQSSGLDPSGKVIFSAYYEPVFPASDRPDPAYPFPLYRRPQDMLEADLGDFNTKWKGEKISGRVSEGRFIPYLTRENIDTDKALAGKNLEIAWLNDPFDRLDLHIEGSGILVFPDGSRKRAQFSGTNAHPYRSVGKILVDSGAIPPSQASHERIRTYFQEHPDAASWAIARNPRYTFFRLEPIEPGSGPRGTIQQPLIAGRSIAVDDKLFPLGLVAYITLPVPLTDDKGKLLALAPTSRFVLTQDTGGAIKGPGRVDLYVGSGNEAKAVATRLWNEGRLYFLIQKLPPPNR